MYSREELEMRQRKIGDVLEKSLMKNQKISQRGVARKSDKNFGGNLKKI